MNVLALLLKFLKWHEIIERTETNVLASMDIPFAAIYYPLRMAQRTDSHTFVLCAIYAIHLSAFVFISFFKQEKQTTTTLDNETEK